MNVVKKIPIFTLLSKNISSNIYIKKKERKQRRLEDSLNLDRKLASCTVPNPRGS